MASPQQQVVFRLQSRHVIGLIFLGSGLLMFALGIVLLTTNGTQEGGVALPVIAVAWSWIGWRFATANVTASASGLRIRNFVRTHHVPWQDAVEFREIGPSGSPCLITVAGTKPTDAFAIAPLRFFPGIKSRAMVERLNALIAQNTQATDVGGTGG